MLTDSSDKTAFYSLSFTYYFSPSSQQNTNRADRISINLFPPPVCGPWGNPVVSTLLFFTHLFSMPVFCYPSLSKMKSFHPPPDKEVHYFPSE